MVTLLVVAGDLVQAVLAPPGGEAVQDGVPGGAAHRARVRPSLHQPRGHPTSLTLNDGIQWLFDF